MTERDEASTPTRVGLCEGLGVRRRENEAAHTLARIAEASCLHTHPRGQFGAPGALILSQPPHVRALLRTLKADDFARLRCPAWLEHK